MLLYVTGAKWEDSVRGTEYSGKPRKYMEDNKHDSYPWMFPPVLVDMENDAVIN